MGSIIACDRQTAEALRTALPNAAPQLHEGDALDIALAAAPADAVLPASGDDVLYIEVRPASTAAPDFGPAERSYQPGGFLGLSDEAVYEDDKDA